MSTPYAPQPAAHTAPVPPLDLTPPAPAAPRKSRPWVWPVAVGAAFLVGLAAGQGGGEPAPAATGTTASDAGEVAALTAERDAAIERAEAAEASVAQRDADAAAAAEADAAAAAAAEAPAGLRDGMYIVGTDIEPGRYSMTATSGLAYVDQKNGDDYLVQELGNEGERIVVDIADVPGSLVSFSGFTGIERIG